MGCKSVKENKNIYQLCRESLDYSRAKAAEKLGWISETRIEKTALEGKIDSEKLNRLSH